MKTATCWYCGRRRPGKALRWGIQPPQCREGFNKCSRGVAGNRLRRLLSRARVTPTFGSRAYLRRRLAAPKWRGVYT